MQDDRSKDKAHSAPPRRRKQHDEIASPRLKARVYTALVRAQQESGPLESLTGSEVNGYGLCLFEKLVQIAPAADRLSTAFFCGTCHARVLAEHMEHAPLPWTHCPYRDFQRS